MLMEYTTKGETYYDINGVQLLLHLSKSQSQKMVIYNNITSINYLNRILYNKDEILEITNLKNLKDQISLRLTDIKTDGEDGADETI